MAPIDSIHLLIPERLSWAVNNFSIGVNNLYNYFSPYVAVFISILFNKLAISKTKITFPLNINSCSMRIRL
jgi:hypothetical protein